MARCPIGPITKRGSKMEPMLETACYGEHKYSTVRKSCIAPKMPATVWGDLAVRIGSVAAEVPAK